MAVKEVYHINLIGHEINESVSVGYPQSDREIFCKKLHKITEPDAETCESCSYFSGWVQGHGHECKWEDVISIELDEKVIPHQSRHEELMRVSKLIDEGVLKKG